MEWYFENHCYKVKVSLDMIDKVTGFIEGLVGCSYFFELTKSGDDVVFGFSSSTFDKKTRT